MSSSPQEGVPSDTIPRGSTLPSGEEIVISGISGHFPNSDNVSQFMKNLYGKMDMVIYNDMNINYPEAPQYVGRINGTRKFDAQFFKVTYNQATSLEPMTRKLCENAYSAIFDSGINPVEFKGTKLGVYVGISYADTSNMTLYNTYRKNGFIISGGSKCMCSNRISYFLDGKAPSVTIDCSCASDLVCLENAYQDIKKGVCECALVAGSQLMYHPTLSVNLKRFGILCHGAETKCFDKNASGYVRSEAAALIFLQKAKHAKRIYAEVVHAKTVFDLKPDATFLPIRNSDEIKSFLKKFYSEAGVSPKDVEYVEAHGAALVEADTNELQAISEVFAENKSIKVGCVKSNMGNAETASGICGITKMCLAYQSGKIPANLHHDDPLDIDCLSNGKVKVVTEHETFNRGLTAINNFSYNGMNCHILLKGHYKPKNIERYACSIPRMVFISGRHDEGVEKSLDVLKNEPIDPEVIGMLHNIFKHDTIEHTARGYAVLDTNEENETVFLSKSVELYSGTKRPLWFVFSGMGSQWAGMGKELMRIPIFAAAIEKCRIALEPKGIDIVSVITDPETSFDYILNCFVGIAAVQIGLVDMLKAMNLVPDYIVGHSVGEMGCAYFDGCFTTEQMILAAYTRGKVSVETEFIKGSMAAVGLGYSELSRMVPPEIDIACRNSFESCTISGPAEDVTAFVASLKEKGIFAKEVPSANISYHSRYIKKAAPEFTRLLSKVLEKPVLRSEKWISTSVPKEKWDEPAAKYSSSEYHTNNLVSPVYFEDAIKLIPSNAVVVEVAPHGLLQAILKRSHPNCTHIPLTRRGHADSVAFLFDAFGKLYLNGFNSNIDVLYPKIEFPVSTETSVISHYVHWYHNEDWPTVIQDNIQKFTMPGRTLTLSVEDDDYNFLTGNVIDDNIVFSESALLFLIWQTYSMYYGKNYEETSIGFRNVQFDEDVHLTLEEPLKLQIMISKGTHRFEVVRNNNVMAYGHLVPEVDPVVTDDNEKEQVKVIELNSKDIYKIFLSKGYNYKNEFQSIVSTSLEKNNGKVKWTGNWVTFLDSLIQFNVLARNHSGISKMKIIKNLAIDVNAHAKQTAKMDFNDYVLPVQLDKYNGETRCGGVVIKDIYFEDKPKVIKEPDVLQELVFVPYHVQGKVDTKTALQINMQIVADNSSKENLTLLECNGDTLHELIKTVSEDIVAKFEMLTLENMLSVEALPNLLIFENFLMNSKFDKMSNFVGKDTFILTLEENNINLKNIQTPYEIVSVMAVETKYLILLRKTSFDDENVIFIPITDDHKFSWVSNVECELQKQRKVILVSEKRINYGLFGLVNKLRREYKNKIALFIIDDSKSLSFSHDTDFYRKQLKKNITFNILKENLWGSYYYLSCPKLQVNVNNCEFKLSKTIDGGNSSLRWTEVDPKLYSDNTVQVSFAGLSLRDAKTAVGIESDAEAKGFGMDFSGVDSKGNKVMGLIPSGALATSVQPDPYFLWPVPAHWSLEEAATVPLPYVHAAYCLLIKNRLYKQQTIFITNGIEALGQAAIYLCLAAGCTIFTSVDNIYKKKLLMKIFPQLNEKHILYSGDTSFHVDIVTMTKNKLCDVVINDHSGVLREYALKCTGRCAFFLDVNHHDMLQNKDIGMAFLWREASYYAVNLQSIFWPQNVEERQIIQMVISEGIARGHIKPLSYVTYSIDEVSKAFKHFSLAVNTGRVIMKVRDNQKSAYVEVVPRMTIASKGTYVVVCDNNGLGVELANRLVERGARNLTLRMKNKSVTGYLQSMLNKWNSDGVSVHISTNSLQTEGDCVSFLKNEHKSTPIYGIFVVLDNCKSRSGSLLDSFGTINEVTTIVSNLDLASVNNCPELRHFVIMSRVSQNAADEYATSALSKIFQKRAKMGLPSLMFRTLLPYEESLTEEDVPTNMQPQSLDTAFRALETSLKLNYNNVLTYDTIKKKTNHFLENVSNILAVKNIEQYDGDLSLKNIVSNEIVTEELISSIKQNNYEISKEELKTMTLKRLKEYGKLNIKSKTKFNSGVSAFYNFVEEDEYEAHVPLIPMITLTNKWEKEEDLDADDNYLMVIPGFEGYSHRYNSLCERLKITAVTLQFGPEINIRSIPDIALNLKDHMTKRFVAKEKFYLLGHSFGVNVALELAALLEKEGRSGVIYCLDSSPDALRIQLDAYLSGLTDSQIQDAILEHFFTLMSGQKSETLSNEIEKCDNWLQKRAICVDKLKKAVAHTTQYTEAVLETAYKKILLAKSYEPNFRLESEIVLLKGVPHPKSGNLPSDYNLSKYSKEPVKVYNITSDVASAPDDYKVPNIINQLLGPEVLAEYKKRNLCDTYLCNTLTVDSK